MAVLLKLSFSRLVEQCRIFQSIYQSILERKRYYYFASAKVLSFVHLLIVFFLSSGTAMLPCIHYLLFFIWMMDFLKFGGTFCHTSVKRDCRFNL